MAIIKSKFLINKIKNWYKNPCQKNLKILISFLETYKKKIKSDGKIKQMMGK